MEQWRPVVGLEGSYEVSNLGRIRHATTGHIRKPYGRPKEGYQQVSYRASGASRSFYVHRAVLEAFRPRPDARGLECHHRDFDPTNNRLENLEWVTKAQNLQYTWQAGRQENGKRLRAQRMRARHQVRRGSFETTPPGGRARDREGAATHYSTARRP